MPQEWDEKGNPVSAPQEWDEQGNPVSGAPATPQPSIGPSKPAAKFGAGDDPENKFTASGFTPPDIEHYTPQGRAEHPVLSRLGDVIRGGRELLGGGKYADKPMGTESGVLNNPATSAVMAAPGAADAAFGMQSGLEDAVSGMRMPRPQIRNSIADFLRKPATARQSQMGIPGAVKPTSPIPILPKAVQPNLPSWMVPKGDLGTPTNPGPFMEIPARMPKATPRSIGGSASPEMPDVLQVPEPNAPAPGEKPGSMYSVKRKQVLMPAAQRGKAGAADVLRDLGQPMVVTPKASGYPGPRSITSFDAESNLRSILDDPMASVAEKEAAAQKLGLKPSITGGQPQ